MAGEVRQQIDRQSLEQYISHNVPAIRPPITLKQFAFGQSNPTYQITDVNRQKFVLRKKPPGSLVSKTAHNVGREFRVLRVLERTDVPVPKTYTLCDDETVIGTPFYIMAFLDGRTFEDPTIPNVSSDERRELWRQAVSVLVRLHRVDLAAVGLADYGKPANFYNRQIDTWRTLHASQGSVADVVTGQPVGPLPHMDEMLEFFSNRRFQPRDRRALIHGDYKIDNLVFHKGKPIVIGVLDWEMSTTGHPLSDISNLLQPFRIAMESSVMAKNLLLVPNPHQELSGLPSVSECVSWYSQGAGWNPGPELRWSDAFALFRGAVVRQGIAARYAARQAGGSTAYEYGQTRTLMVMLTRKAIEEIKEKNLNYNSPNGKL